MAEEHRCARAVVAIPLHSMAALIVQDHPLKIKLATPMSASVGFILVTEVFLKKNMMCLYFDNKKLMEKRINKPQNTLKTKMNFYV